MRLRRARRQYHSQIVLLDPAAQADPAVALHALAMLNNAYNAYTNL